MTCPVVVVDAVDICNVSETFLSRSLLVASFESVEVRSLVEEAVDEALYLGEILRRFAACSDFSSAATSSPLRLFFTERWGRPEGETESVAMLISQIVL